MVEIPQSVTISESTEKGQRERQFVVTNEVTGQYFAADLRTVQFIEEFRKNSSLTAAAAASGIDEEDAKVLVGKLHMHGILLGDGLGSPPKKAPPLEGRLISFRVDLFDAARIAARLHLLGKYMFSWVGLAIWSLLVGAALIAFLQNGDKVAASLRILPTSTVGDIAAFVALFVSLKLFHELGHILAYRIFCLRAGFEPGPIRTGIMVFAATPFPYTDVTGAWRLSSRTQRAAIGAAGVYFEMFAVALLTLYWASTTLGASHALILQVAVFSGAMTLLFNLNPAVKLDGYYIFSDLLGQTNLAGRASLAARQWIAARLGAQVPAPAKGDLAYWCISYLYRLTIFAGVFWLAYQFDVRLAPVVLIAALLLLVVRPAAASFSYARSNGASLMRSGLVLGFLAGAAVLLALPLPARVLVSGNFLTHETEYVRAPDAAQILSSSSPGSIVTLRNPSLEQLAQDAELRREIIANLSLSPGTSAAEKEALKRDVDSLENLKSELNVRLDALTINIPETAIWTEGASDQLNGFWILPSSDQPVGAISRPTAPFVRIALAQNRLDSGLQARQNDEIIIRFKADPRCEIAGKLRTDLAETTAQNGEIEMEATIGNPLPICAARLNSGASVVARLELPPKSAFQHIHILVLRMLQNRLPSDNEQTG